MPIIDATNADLEKQRDWGNRFETLKHIHHYMSLAKFNRLHSIVMKSRLYFASLKQLNDPFDGAISIDFDATPEEIRAFWTERALERGLNLAAAQPRIEQFVSGRDSADNRAQMNKLLANAIAPFGVVCFSEPDNDLLMWSYYAHGHAGVCLRFHARALIELASPGPPVQVAYEADYPRISFYRDSRFRRTWGQFATKSLVWQHEQEWRIVRLHGARSKQSFDPASLDAIIMGCKISSQNEGRIRRMVRERVPKVKLLKAEAAADAFRLDMTPA
jgi:hypothetical protein